MKGIVGENEELKEIQIPHWQFVKLSKWEPIEVTRVWDKLAHYVTVMDDETGESMNCSAHHQPGGKLDGTNSYKLYRL